jgi:hypothetical protein
LPQLKGLGHCADYVSLEGCVPKGCLCVVKEVGDVAGTVGWFAAGYVPPIKVAMKPQSSWCLTIIPRQYLDCRNRFEQIP